MHFPERPADKEKKEDYFQRACVGGIKCNRCRFIVCVWVLFRCVIPEIAKKIWNSNWLERRRGSERGRSKGSEARREKGEDGVVDRKLMIKPTSLSSPFSPSPKLTALFAFLCSSAHLSSLFPSLLSSPPLHYFEALDCFPSWLTIGWLAVCHQNQHFRTILRTFYPNPVPLWGSMKK